MRVTNVPMIGDDNSKSKAAMERLDETTSNFMKMLTTQLQNQDPTDPLDHEALTAQIVGFMGLEQNIQSNQYLEKLVSLNEHTGIGNGIPYLGAEVGAEARFIRTPTTLENGKMSFDYSQSKDAESTEIKIYTPEGKLVYSKMANDTRQGPHNFTWNGLDKEYHKLGDGTYYIEVEALDKDDIRVPVKSTVKGTVTSITKKDGKLYLNSNGREFEAGDINYIRYPENKPSNNSTSLVDIFG